MRLISWGIIFVIIVFSFSYMNRVVIENKKVTMMQEVKYNNAIDQATMDATNELSRQMINLSDGVDETTDMVQGAIDKFFTTFSLGFGYYGGNTKETNVKMYVPAMVVLVNDGFYMYSMEQIIKPDGKVYYEHTLKPKVPFTFTDDKTGDNGQEGQDMFARDVVFTLDNTVTALSKKQSGNNAETKVVTGRIVDTRHYTDIMNSVNEVYVRYSADNKVKYTKQFYDVYQQRHLLEEWYDMTQNPVKLIKKRITPYSYSDYNFTLNTVGGLDRYYSHYPGNYMTQGNPENTGEIDPLTGQYTVGEFNKKKREIITRQIKQKLEYYVATHNKYAQANDLVYTFTLPELHSTEWANVLSDITILVFVQGIPMNGESFYNNYAFAGARVIDREIFYGIPPEPTATDDRVYYSSRMVDSKDQYLFERNNARLFNSQKDAAMYGYYPNIAGDSADLDEIIDTVRKINFNLVPSVTNCSATNFTINITDLPATTLVNQIKYAKGDYTSDPSYFTVGGIPLNRMAREFGTNGNGTYTVWIQDFDGTIGVQKIIINNIDDVDLTITATVANCHDGLMPVVVTFPGKTTYSPIQSKKYRLGTYTVAQMATTGTAFTGTTFEVNVQGTYTVYAKDCVGREAVTTVVVTPVGNGIPTTPVITRNPTDMSILTGTNIAISAISSDPNGDPITYVWERMLPGETTWTVLGSTGTSIPTQAYTTQGAYFFRVKARDIYGSESAYAMTNFIISTYTGGMQLTGPSSTLIQDAPPGTSIIGYKFFVPLVNGHAGSDYGRIKLYNKTTGLWEQYAYISTYNGTIMDTQNFKANPYPTWYTGSSYKSYCSPLRSNAIPAGKYTKIEFYYYATHCMYNKSNITYEVLYDFGG